MDIRRYPIQVQSAMVTEECRLALFNSPGNLFSFHHYNHPLIQNKLLLLDEVIDYSKAEEYLKDGFIINSQYQMDVNLRNLIEVILPNMNQIISFEMVASVVFLHSTIASNISFIQTIYLKWVGLSRQSFI